MNTTTSTYALKREIVNLSRKLAEGTPMAQKRFVADMMYGVTASSSCILSKIADTLKKRIDKGNTIDRLSRHLKSGPPEALEENYRRLVKGQISLTGNIFVDDSDIIKPYGHAFEDLGSVRDGSSIDKRREKGYNVA
ncbi:MAG: hypothetical protein AB9880_08520 [Christensenellales bacterium]